MLDPAVRSHTSRVLAPLVARLHRVPPLAITAGGLVVGLVAVALAAGGWWLPALAAWLANRLADGVDGEVARSAGRDGDRGYYLDLVADAVVYGTLPIGVAAGIGTGAAWTAAAVLVASFYVNIVSLTMLVAALARRSARATGHGVPVGAALPSGLIEGTETIVFLSAMLLIPRAAVALMVVMAMAVTVTAIVRVVTAWPLLDSEQDESHEDGDGDGAGDGPVPPQSRSGSGR